MVEEKKGDITDREKQAFRVVEGLFGKISSAATLLPSGSARRWSRCPS